MSSAAAYPTDHEWRIVRTCVWVSAAFSMIGASVIIAMYARHRAIRSFSVKLLVYLSIADLLAAGSHYLHSPPAWDGEDSHRRHFPCQLQAVCQHFFFLASFFWTLCFAINQYLHVCHHERAAFKYEPFYHGIAWGTPLVSCVCIATVNGFGPTDLWCWIPAQHQLLRWLSFYGPLLLIVVTVGVLAALSMWELRSEDRRRRKAAASALSVDMTLAVGENHHHQHAHSQSQRPALGARWHLETVLYLIAFVFIRLPGVIHRLFELFPHGAEAANMLFVLELLHGIFSPLQGFINGILFLSNRTVRSHLHLGQWCACTLCLQKKPSHAYFPVSAADHAAADDTAGLLAAHRNDAAAVTIHPQSADDSATEATAESAMAVNDGGDHTAEALHARFSSIDLSEHSNLEPFPAHIGKDDIVPIFVGTWNMARMPPPSLHDLRFFIPRDGYDLYVVGVQECVYNPLSASSSSATASPAPFSKMPHHAVDRRDATGSFTSLHSTDAPAMASEHVSASATTSSTCGGKTPHHPHATVPRTIVVTPCEEHFFGLVRSLLGDAFVTLATASMGGIRMIVLVRRSMAGSVTQVRCASEATGVANVGGNKGAVGVSLRLGSLSLCFVTMHLAAHQSGLSDRNRDLLQIIQRLQLGDLDLVSQYHAFFLLGDLNYRLSLSTAHALRLISHESWEKLRKHDELTQLRLSKKLLYGFAEGGLYFQPTYKYFTGVVNGHRYDSSSRTPAWCDRVLWRVRQGVSLQQTYYSHAAEVCTSDHKPVKSCFRIGYPNLLRVPTPFQPLLLLSSANADSALLARYGARWSTDAFVGATTVRASDAQQTSHSVPSAAPMGVSAAISRPQPPQQQPPPSHQMDTMVRGDSATPTVAEDEDAEEDWALLPHTSLPANHATSAEPRDVTLSVSIPEPAPRFPSVVQKHGKPQGKTPSSEFTDAFSEYDEWSVGSSAPTTPASHHVIVSSMASTTTASSPAKRFASSGTKLENLVEQLAVAEEFIVSGWVVQFSGVSAIGMTGPRGVELVEPYITFKAEVFPASSTPFTSLSGILDESAEWVDTAESKSPDRVRGSDPSRAPEATAPTFCWATLPTLPVAHESPYRRREVVAPPPSASSTKRRKSERSSRPHATAIGNVPKPSAVSGGTLASPLDSVTSAVPSYDFGWQREDLETACVVLLFRDAVLAGDDDVAGSCAIELRDAVSTAGTYFQVPVLLDSAYNGYAVGRVRVVRCAVPVMRSRTIAAVVDSSETSTSVSHTTRDRGHMAVDTAASTSTGKPCSRGKPPSLAIDVVRDAQL